MPISLLMHRSGTAEARVAEHRSLLMHCNDHWQGRMPFLDPELDALTGGVGGRRPFVQSHETTEVNERRRGKPGCLLHPGPRRRDSTARA